MMVRCVAAAPVLSGKVLKPLDILFKSAKIDHELQQEDGGRRISNRQTRPRTADGLTIRGM